MKKFIRSYFANKSLQPVAAAVYKLVQGDLITPLNLQPNISKTNMLSMVLQGMAWSNGAAGLGLALLQLSWDKNWDSHLLVNGYPSFYPRIALAVPSPGQYVRPGGPYYST